MLRINQQPVVSAVCQLLCDRWTVRVEEEAHLRHPLPQLFFEIGATQSGFRHMQSSSDSINVLQCNSGAVLSEKIAEAHCFSPLSLLQTPRPHPMLSSDGTTLHCKVSATRNSGLQWWHALWRLFTPASTTRGVRMTRE